jgi:glycerol uptake facilitator-like aquaporin
LWTLIAGAQLVDIGWSALVIAGVEGGHIDPSLPGSPLVLAHMPWTHSLPAAIAWALAAAMLVKLVLRVPARVAVVVAVVVFSHWLLDLVVHRPDLELYPNGPKLGFGLWNMEVVEQAVEIGLLGLGAMFWAGQRARLDQSVWPAAAFFGLLVAVQIIAMLMPREPADTLTGFGPSALAIYLVLAGVAVFLDGRRASSPQGSA